MSVRRLWRGGALVVLVALLVSVDAQAQGGDDLTALQRQVIQLHGQGKFAEALPVAERYVAVARQRHGEGHAEFATAILWLASVYKAQARFGDAEPLMRRALAISEKSLGPEHTQVARALNNLAELLRATDRVAEAEPLMRRVITIVEKSLGADHSTVAIALNSLAQLLQDTDRLAEAEPLLRRALAISEKSLGPQHSSVATRLNNLAVFLGTTNRLVEAEPLFRRALAISEKSFGPEHPQVGNNVSNLAGLLRDTNRLTEAEPLMRRALAISEKSFGPQHPQVARDLNVLAGLLRATNRLTEAEPLMRRALAISEDSLGPHHPQVAMALLWLGGVYQAQSRYAEAEALMRRALAISEKSLGSEHSNVANALSTLAELLRAIDRLAEAEPLMRRDLAISENSLGPDHPQVARALNNLATLLQATNRLAESEQLMRRALAISEKSLGPEHPEVGTRLSNLATLLRETNRLAEAEPLMRRSVAIDDKSFGPDHPNVALRLSILALVLQDTHRFAEAEPLMRRALAISEKSFGPQHPQVARNLNNLAVLLRAINRLTDAEPLMRRALAISEKSLGSEHPSVANSLANLALLLQDTNRLVEAESLMRRTLSIDEKSFGPDHPTVARDLNNLAQLRAERGDWAEAATLHGRAKPILIARKEGDGGDRAGLAKSALAGNTRAFRAHARALHRANADSASAREESFELAQWALQTGAADALAQMSVRFTQGAGPLTQVVRERQDLIGRRQGEDKRLLAAVGAADAKAADAIRTAMADLDTRLDAIDRQLANDFPEYAGLANPKPLTTRAMQALLHPHEALVVFLDVPRIGRLPEETLTWVITKTEARWVSIPLGTGALRRTVAVLRCGLDSTSWKGGEAQDRCVDAVRAHPPQENIDGQVVEVLPFDLERAHALYKALLGPVDDMIKGKQLLVVPSGPLTSLPFHVLVTEQPKIRIPRALAEYREVAWLGTRQPITVLPSVASLKSLRQFARASRASKVYLGIGNPLLDGQQDHPQWGEHHKKQAEAARSKQQCPGAQSQRSAQTTTRLPYGFEKLFRGAQADIEEVRRWTPLPETADELCEVGRRLGVPESEILLGSRATEVAVKLLSEKGRLADYAILHFATHGALTGQVQGLAEPGLTLTPPPKGTRDAQALDRDDGFLTASEIATLKLDADWVVLSACNTAGPSGETAEPLSGMARAFFYAGARALLVSHWEVGSEAAVKLTTKAFAELKADRRMGRAEALRISMRELIEKGTAFEAHPSQWAPFVVVGEGAAR